MRFERAVRIQKERGLKQGNQRGKAHRFVQVRGVSGRERRERTDRKGGREERGVSRPDELL